jgi:ribosomal protein L31E
MVHTQFCLCFKELKQQVLRLPIRLPVIKQPIRQLVIRRLKLVPKQLAGRRIILELKQLVAKHMKQVEHIMVKGNL